MSKSVEELSKLLDQVAADVEEHGKRIVELETLLHTVEDLARHTGGDGKALPVDHVFSPNRKGLADYEDARMKLGKMKPGDKHEIKHMGKTITVDFAMSRELLRQGKIL